MKLLTIIFVVSLIKYNVAVDRSIFKTCEQSSFCRRCRYQNASSYEVLTETLYTDSTYVSVEIRNQDNGQLFFLKLSALEVCVRLDLLKLPVNYNFSPFYRTAHFILKLMKKLL